MSYPLDSGDAFPVISNVTSFNPEIKYSINTISYYYWGSDSRGYTGITIDNIIEKYKEITANVYITK